MSVMVGSYNPILILKASSRLLPNSRMFVDIICEHGTNKYGLKQWIMDSTYHHMNSSMTKHRPTFSPVEVTKMTCYQVTAVVWLLDGVLVLQLSFDELNFA